MAAGGVTQAKLRQQEKDGSLGKGPGLKTWPVPAAPIKFETIKHYWSKPKDMEQRRYVQVIQAGEGIRAPGRPPLCPEAEKSIADVDSTIILRDGPLHHREIKKMARAVFIELGLQDVCGRPYTKDTNMDNWYKAWVKRSNIEGIDFSHRKGYSKEEVDELKEKVKAATAAEKKALQSKHKAGKELKVSRDQLAEVNAAEVDLEASLRKANGDVARALKSLRSMTTLKTFVYSRQDAPPRVALRTISKAVLGDKWASQLNAPRAEYDTGIAAKASAVERVQKEHEEAEKELELQQGLLEHEQEWHHEYSRQLNEVKEHMAERQNTAWHG
eukprot:jgi/Tetstr1/427916/TSEL_017991.t1